jgi:hypothetical protein
MKKLKHALINWLARNLLPVIDDTDVISFNKMGEIFFDGQKLSDIQKSNLKSEASFLEESMLWNVMNKYFLRLARNKVYNESNSLEDMAYAKTVLFTLDVQKTLVDKLKNIK